MTEIQDYVHGPIPAIVPLLAVRGITFGPIVFKFYDKDPITNIETPQNIMSDDFVLKVGIGLFLNPVLTFGIGTGLTKQNTNELVLNKNAAQMIVPIGEYEYILIRTTVSLIVTDEATGKFKIV